MANLNPLALFQPQEVERLTKKWRRVRGCTNSELGALLGHIAALQKRPSVHTDECAYVERGEDCSCGLWAFESTATELKVPQEQCSQSDAATKQS